LDRCIWRALLPMNWTLADLVFWILIQESRCSAIVGYLRSLVPKVSREDLNGYLGSIRRRSIFLKWNFNLWEKLI
jgi:hypothetical protein